MSPNLYNAMENSIQLRRVELCLDFMPVSEPMGWYENHQAYRHEAFGPFLASGFDKL